MRISQPAPLQGAMFPRRLAGTGSAQEAVVTPQTDRFTPTRPVQFVGHREHISWYMPGMSRAYVEQALKARKPVDDEDFTHNTPLMLASWIGDLDVVELLLAKRANVNHKNDVGHTALTLAAEKGHRNVVELLLAKGSQIKHKTNVGDTALMLAEQKGHKEIATLLKAAEEKLHKALEDLLSACREGDTNRIHEILKNPHLESVSENPLSLMLDGQTPLMAAAGHGHLRAVRLLMNRKADAHQQNQEGETALSKAAQGGHLPVISDLIAHGSKVSLQDIQALLKHIQPQDPPTLVEQGMSHLSRAAATDNVEEISKHFGKHLRRGDDEEKRKQWLNKLDKQDLTPLMQAAKYGKLSAICELLDSGADISTRNAKGETALTQAMRHKQIEAIRLLLEELERDEDPTPEDVRLLLDESDSDSGSETYYSPPASPKREHHAWIEESPTWHAGPSFDLSPPPSPSRNTENIYTSTFEDYSWENPWQNR